MKILKNVLIVVIVLLAIPLIAALFIKSEYHVEREVTIDAPNAQVFDYVKYLKNQNNYSKWSQVDPNMDKTYSGVDGTVGFVSAWSSENKDVGVGEQEILEIQDGERIDYELRFLIPFEATSYAYITTEPLSSTTTLITWSFDGKMDYPMNIMLPFYDFDGILGADLQTGLNQLKTILERD